MLPSSGSDRLDDAAVECVSSWHDRPAAIKDSQAVDAPMNVKVVWNLEEDAGRLWNGTRKTATPAGRRSKTDAPKTPNSSACLRGSS
jgi:hypothetical protein